MRSIRRSGKVFLPKSIYELSLTAPSNANVLQEYVELNLDVPSDKDILDQFNGIHKIIIPIGVWDMDATASITVTHGLDSTKIRNIEGYVISDDLITRYPSGTIDVALGNVQWMIVSWNTTTVSLTRRPSGTFDATSFNDTGISRGNLIIDYVL